MITLFKHEMRMNFKSLLIWALSVGLMGMICTLMYKSMEGQIDEMAASFAQMGAFADAFGMNTLSIATVAGFFASEVGAIHGLGSAMFAATISIIILSKEEDAHTAEFLLTHPFKRRTIVTSKLLALITNMVLLTLVCAVCYLVGFAGVGGEIPFKDLVLFLVMEFLMNLEVMAICFFVSAVSQKNRFGAGLGMALALYLFDIVSRVIPDLKDYAFVGPFSFANATDIFAHHDLAAKGIVLSIVLTVACIAGAYGVYCKRDMVS